MNVNQIVAEYQSLSDSGFWKLYNAKLDELLSNRLDKLRNGALDTILYTQGGVKTLEIVKTIPNTIMLELAEQSKKGV